MSKSIEEVRIDAWVKAWCATINSPNCYGVQNATNCADKMLEAFDDRFIN